MKKWIPALLAGALLTVATAQADKTAGDVVDDNTVNASVKAALIENKTTKANNINVETYKGVVQLSGFVETAGGEGRSRTGRRGCRRGQERQQTSRSAARPRWAPSSTTA